MLPEHQSRLIVVLVRARNPSNIGAVARAMHDLGFAHLRIVNDYPVPFQAAKAAVDASSVLAAATEHTSVAAAVADCTLVFGTTAVGERKLDQPLHTLAQATPFIQQTLAGSPHARVALLFGSEKTGLSNDELSHCHALLTIPMNNQAPAGEPTRHLSMNLGQAAAVCLYTLAQPTPSPVALTPPLSPESTVSLSGPQDPRPQDPRHPDPRHPDPRHPDPATAADLERLTALLGEVLTQSGYTRRHPANSRENNVRRLIRRMANSHEDAAVWSGILRQLLHTLSKPT